MPKIFLGRNLYRNRNPNPPAADFFSGDEIVVTQKETPVPRYAVYFVPEAGTPLATFGARWLGYDIETGVRAPRDYLGLDPDLADQVVAEPAIYGFHATLKAPFRLRNSASPELLTERLARVAQSKRRIGNVRLEVAQLGSFLALRPAFGAGLTRLASQFTMSLESFRAPISERERQHRLGANLTPYQRILFETYGYPFVLDEFRFHMSLTGPLEKSERKTVEPALRDAKADLAADPIEVSSICLAVQPEPGAPFRVQERFALCH